MPKNIAIMKTKINEQNYVSIKYKEFFFDSIFRHCLIGRPEKFVCFLCFAIKITIQK